MLEVSYYIEALFDLTIDSGAYHAIKKFSDNDPTATEYYASQFQLGRELEDFLCSIYKHHISVHDEDVAADYWAVDTDVGTFSDQMIKRVMSFLRDKSPLYSAIICLYEDLEIIGSAYMGRVIVTLERIGVTLQIKDIFEAKCRSSLSRHESTVIFNEAS